MFEDETAYGLSAMAGCGAPNSGGSAGADLLGSVARALSDAIEYVIADKTNDYSAANMRELIDALRDEGDLSTIADGAPSIYTHTMWSEFLDLSAYQEDPSELGFELNGSDGAGMEDAARVCLYIIAERLVGALCEQAIDDAEEAAELAAEVES